MYLNGLRPDNMYFYQSHNFYVTYKIRQKKFQYVNKCTINLIERKKVRNISMDDGDYNTLEENSYPYDGILTSNRYTFETRKMLPGYSN